MARSRRRIARLLLGLVCGMGLVALWLLLVGRWGPALVSLAAAALAWLAWRMSGDLDPLWLSVREGELAVQMRRQRTSLELRHPRTRRLDAEEIDHLRSLTEASGVTFATASYESHRLGAFDLFATCLDHAVLVEVDPPPGEDDEGPHRWIVTPDDPDGLTAAVCGSAARREPDAASPAA